MTTTASAPRTPLDLEELRRRSVAGDLVAWGQVVAIYRREVFDYHFQMTRDHHDADDLTQRTFETAWRHPPVNLGAAQSFSPWLLAVAFNLCRQARGRQRTWEELSPELVANEVSPAERATSDDELVHFWTLAEKHLYARDYEICWFRFGECLSEEQTAEVAGVSRHQVAVALHRARKILATFRHSHS